MMVLPTLREASCPACSHNVAVPFLASEPQPLATLAWPATDEEARGLKRLPLEFVRCVECGHVFNAAFTYDEVPYSEKPNRMFNSGAIWSQFLESMVQSILRRLPAQPVVVEIGHGDGSFLAGLAERCQGGHFYGFDPHGAAPDLAGVSFRAEMFVPEIHLQELRPDLVVSRHVLEHLISPLAFLQRLSFVAAALGQKPLAYFEVPCIDRVLETGRTVDFYYEHSSQFTTASFRRMLESCDADVLEVGHGYDREVVFGFAHLGVREQLITHAEEAAAYLQTTGEALSVIQGQLADLLASGKRMAIWGGTGKSAAFLGRYGLDAERFPLVVDSDPDKAGTFVPGTGQEIVFRDCLQSSPVDVVIVPPQWRARDIVQEMAANDIGVEQVLIEHAGRLIDFATEPHPYG